MRGLTLPSILLGLALGAPLAGFAASIEGQHFDDGIHLANSDLRLNGLGVRGNALIKGYAAGLYVSQKVSTYPELRDAPGPKRLQLRMMRSAGPEVFIDALVSGLRKNLGPAELQQMEERTAQLKRNIEAFGVTAKGDVINFDFVPGSGTTLSVNGAVKAPAIAGDDFFDALLAIFTGDRPVDKRLKQGLLGQ